MSVKRFVAKALEALCVLADVLYRVPVLRNLYRCQFAVLSEKLDRKWDTGVWRE